MFPQAFAAPEALAAVDRGEDGAERADPAAGHEVDAHARFVQGAQHAGMVGAGSAGAGQHERGAKARGVLTIRSVGCDHKPAGDGHRRTQNNAKRRRLMQRGNGLIRRGWCEA